MTTAIRTVRAVRPLLAAAAVAAMAGAGCSSLPPMVGPGNSVAEGSSVKAEVEAASRRPGPYPEFSDIPKAPKDVRPVATWGRDVAAAKADRTQVQAEVANLPRTLTDSEGWAAATRARADAPPPAEAVSTEAFLAEMQAKAKPPKPPK